MSRPSHLGAFVSVAATVLCLNGFGAVAQGVGEDFVMVRGAQYEGVIIPAGSSWHRFVWDDPAIRGLHAVTGAWTPTAKQVEEAEQGLQVSVAGLVRQAASNENFPDTRQLFVMGDVRQLAASLPRLRRQYIGIISASKQVILIHGVSDVSDRWKSEARLIHGAGCQQFWADFDTQGQKITTIRCGSLD